MEIERRPKYKALRLLVTDRQNDLQPDIQRIIDEIMPNFIAESIENARRTLSSQQPTSSIEQILKNFVNQHHEETLNIVVNRSKDVSKTPGIRIDNLYVPTDVIMVVIHWRYIDSIGFDVLVRLVRGSSETKSKSILNNPQLEIIKVNGSDEIENLKITLNRTQNPKDALSAHFENILVPIGYKVQASQIHLVNGLQVSLRFFKK